MPRGFHWSESFVVQLLQDVLGSLQVVHSHGLIHGDIKPSNLIRRHQDERLVLIDFGCVKQAWTQVVTAPAKKNNTFTDVIPPTIVVGTPGYMPPEQVRGFPRPNSDIYALGMIAIQALTGLHPKQLPEGLETGEILWQQHARISVQLTHVLEKMVCYHFKKRYQSAIEVLEALQPLTIPDKLTQHLEFSGGEATSAQRLETATRKRPISLSEQDTILGSEALLDMSASDTVHLTSTKKSILLMGMAIGVTTVLAATVGIYYLLQPPPPASPVQQKSLSRQAKVMTR
jgi:serine/threonine protein kinase